MNGLGLTCLAALGAAFLGFAGPAAAFDGRHQVVSTVGTIGAPIATTTRAQVLYVVPVVPTVLGIRPAPVGQPLVYVIEQPEAAANHRHTTGGPVNSAEAAAPEAPADGPRVITID